MTGKYKTERSSEAGEGKEHMGKETKVYDATAGSKSLWWQIKENGAGKAKT